MVMQNVLPRHIRFIQISPKKCSACLTSELFVISGIKFRSPKVQKIIEYWTHIDFKDKYLKLTNSIFMTEYKPEVGTDKLYS